MRLIRQPGKEKQLISKTTAHSIQTTNISYIFLYKIAQIFYYLANKSLKLIHREVAVFCVFKSTFFLNSVRVKPERVVLSKKLSGPSREYYDSIRY